VPAFGQFGCVGWLKQQIIKLSVADHVSTDYFLTLDPRRHPVQTDDRHGYFRRRKVNPQGGTTMRPPFVMGGFCQNARHTV
jgi:hypothetical protein